MGPPLLAAAVAVGLTVATMLPGVAFWDTGEFQVVAPLMGTAHSPGYPTYVLLGWLANLLLAPFGEPAFRLNLFSGLCVAAGAALIVVLVQRLTGRAMVGVAAGVGLAASPLAWRLGTHAEPHALHLAFVALLLVLLVGWELARKRQAVHADRWLVAAAAAFGLADGNHSLTLLLAPSIGLYVLAVQPSIIRRPRLIAACVAAALGALALVYLELPIRAGILRAPLVYGRPDTWEGFWYIFFAQQFQGAVSGPLSDLPRKAADLVTLANQQLGALALFLPAAFIITLGRYPRFALLTGLATVTTWLFSASYANADISRYYMGPLLMAWAWLGILAGVAVELVLDVAARRSHESSGETDRLARRPRPGQALALVLAALLVLPTVLAIPGRYRQLDESGDVGAAIWVDAALDRIAQNAVVVSWWSYSTPLWYATLVQGRRPDILVVDDRTMLDERLGGATDVIGRYLGQRPVYVIRANDHDLGLVRARFTIQPGSGPAANVYEVTGTVKQGS